LAEDGEKLGLGTSANGVVLALIDGRLDEVVAFADFDNFLDILDLEVGKAKAFKFAIFVGFVHGKAGLFERSCSVRRV